MKKTFTPIVMSYGTIARPEAGMAVAPLHLSKSNLTNQLLIPLTSKNRIQQQCLHNWHA